MKLDKSKHIIVGESGRKLKSSDRVVFVNMDIGDRQAAFQTALRQIGRELIESREEVKRVYFAIRLDENLQPYEPLYPFVTDVRNDKNYTYVSIDSVTKEIRSIDVLGQSFILDEQYERVLKYFDGMLEKQIKDPEWRVKSEIPAYLVHGLSGSGKTLFGYEYVKYLKSLGLDVDFVEAFPPDMSPQEWVWTKSLEVQYGATKTVNELTEMAKMLLEDTDKPLFVLVDEVNRGTTEAYVKPFIPILAQRRINIAGSTYHIVRPVVMYFTANIGYEFSSCNLGVAFQNRVMKMKKTPQTKEEVASIIEMQTVFKKTDRETTQACAIYEKVRAKCKEHEVPEISVRQIIKSLNAYEVGCSWIDAFCDTLSYVDESGETNSNFDAQVKNIIISHRV